MDPSSINVPTPPKSDNLGDVSTHSGAIANIEAHLASLSSFLSSTVGFLMSPAPASGGVIGQLEREALAEALSILTKYFPALAPILVRLTAEPAPAPPEPPPPPPLPV